MLLFQEPKFRETQVKMPLVLGEIFLHNNKVLWFNLVACTHKHGIVMFNEFFATLFHTVSVNTPSREKTEVKDKFLFFSENANLSAIFFKQMTTFDQIFTFT